MIVILKSNVELIFSDGFTFNIREETARFNVFHRYFEKLLKLSNKYNCLQDKNQNDETQTTLFRLKQFFCPLELLTRSIFN